jgi:hypothetical protein
MAAANAQGSLAALAVLAWATIAATVAVFAWMVRHRRR